MQLSVFRNLELVDFSISENQEKMEQAIVLVRSQLGHEYDIVIGGRHLRTENKFQSFNPSLKSEVVGVFQKGDGALVEPAMKAAESAFGEWSRTSPEERVKLVLEVARLLRERRFELSAWMVLEVGKSWVEADADLAEAVDFCEFYGREMLRLAQPQALVHYEPEENETVYIPLGVGVIIPPWNFPLAILTGMSMAAIVAGNTVVLKPSSDSPTIAAQFVKICEEVGFPPGVINFVTGGGGEIGEPLVVHPRTRFVSFTGSMQVGTRINELAARRQPGQIWLKRVVAEMGGKDAIIVDEECDLEEAAGGVVAAAFGFQGQKCSACSRAIVLESIHDDFVELVEQKTRELVRVGSVEDPSVNFGPVINQRASERILSYIEKGKGQGDLLSGGHSGAEEGYYIEPTILTNVDPRAVIAQEEIFGPVLAVIRARDYEEALRIANNTIFGLTGAVYTTNSEKLERARQEFHVGNLYLNRKCTGALVGIHPFGGFNMSGTDSKAGGRDYMLLFTQAKSIARMLP